MIKKFQLWLQKFLGITAISSKLHNLDGDITSIMNHQLDSADCIPTDDPPECDEKSPYKFLSKEDMDGEEVEYGWYAVWFVGFAGPFKDEAEARDWAQFNDVTSKQFYVVEKLAALPFEVK